MNYTYKPDWAVPPGETLLEWLCERFEKESGIDVTTLERLIRGETELTDSIAAKLYAATGIPIRLWINLEKDYREHLNRKIEEVDAGFHCTYYTEGEGAKKWKMVICTSEKNTTSPAECQNDAPTSPVPAATNSPTAHGKATSGGGAQSPTASENPTSAVQTTAS